MPALALSPLQVAVQGLQPLTNQGVQPLCVATHGFVCRALGKVDFDYQPISRRGGFYRGVDGRLTASKRIESVVSYSQELPLAAGETISELRVQPANLTISAGGVGTNTLLLTVGPGTGIARVLIDTSSGQRIERRFRWVRVGTLPADYRGTPATAWRGPKPRR